MATAEYIAATTEAWVSHAKHESWKIPESEVDEYMHVAYPLSMETLEHDRSSSMPSFFNQNLIRAELSVVERS